MSNPVVHFEILGPDPQVLQRFYAAAFGWDIRQATPTYAMAHPGGAGINGGIGNANGSTGRVTFYVEVESLDSALSTVERLGGHRVLAPTDVPGGPTIAIFADPAGNAIGLLQAASGRRSAS